MEGEPEDCYTFDLVQGFRQVACIREQNLFQPVLGTTPGILAYSVSWVCHPIHSELSVSSSVNGDNDNFPRGCVRIGPEQEFRK